MNQFNDYSDSEFDETKEIDLWEYWAVIWKRKWLIFALSLLVLIVVAFKTFTTTPTYTATGTLLIEKEPNILSFEEVLQIETLRDDFLQTQYKLLKSRALAQSVIERMSLYEHEEFVGKSEDRTEPIDTSNPRFKSNLINSLLGRITVEPIRGTRLVEITFDAEDPIFAASALNNLFDEFIDMNIEARYQATEQASEFLIKQITSLQAEVSQKERELQSYGAEKNIIALSDTETTIIDKLGELNSALTSAQIERVNKEAYYSEIRGASPDYIPEALTNPLVTKLREDYVRLNTEYRKKEETFRPDYPEMQRLKVELDSAKLALANETQNLIKGAYSDYQAALKKERSLEAVFNNQKKDAIELNSNAILYNSLKIEIENKKNLIESLLRRQSEAGVSSRLRGLRTSNIRIVDRAEIPLSPSSPKKKRNMILALMVGLILGLGTAFGLEYLDNSVKTPEDVERYTKLPTYGLVPAFSSDGLGRGYGHKKKKTKNEGSSPTDKPLSDAKARWSLEDKKKEIKSIELINCFSPHSTYSESYRSIRTALLLSSVDDSLKAIGVTSPLPKEGKSVTIANLGVVLAQAGKNVVIVDTDLRKPRQHKIFKVKNINGITNHMTGSVAIKELIKQTSVPGLFVINSGPVPPNPAELLGSNKMDHFIQNLKKTFDHVLFDLPPMLNIADALILGAKIDGLLLVIWGGKTSREVVKHAREKLDLMKVKTVGVILNNIDIKKQGGYYYKHYYSYYYGADERVEESPQV